jgi:hypothetical protein
MNIPEPFIGNSEKLKAIVLGCDPTAFNKNKIRIKFDTVFGLGGNDLRYFAGIQSNLLSIGINLEEIYVQNLITEYQKYESSKNKEWHITSQKFISARVTEFDTIDPMRILPVLLTSELLYKALLNNGEKRIAAKDFYNGKVSIPITPDQNKLYRPLIPFYRHRKYNLRNQGEYVRKLQSIFSPEA